jgi:hypothetical protein
MRNYYSKPCPILNNKNRKGTKNEKLKSII